ncbi:hypothetical protein [Piscirickettsia litoralis]|uniref:hypothetical protein n=1 Tax=Piscirickettsia litoralis TaxID=1891921 RepID=UPI001112CA4C|nr:hypothetical protein [Piscirickettsia litoralis]
MKKQHSSAEAKSYLMDNRGSLYETRLVNEFSEIMDVLLENYQYLNRLRACELQRGMILANDLYTNKGALLLTKDQVLNKPMIDKITDMSENLGERLIINIKGSKK